MSNIEWTDSTWNPVIGCTPVSPGCLNCYAATMANRLQANPQAPEYAPRLSDDEHDEAGNARTIAIVDIVSGLKSHAGMRYGSLVKEQP